MGFERKVIGLLFSNFSCWLFLNRFAVSFEAAKPGRAAATLRWRHNRHDSVSNHQPHHCLPNRLFGWRSKKTSKLRVTGLCAGNSPGTGEFSAQMASNAEKCFHLMTSSWAGLVEVVSRIIRFIYFKGCKLCLFKNRILKRKCHVVCTGSCDKLWQLPAHLAAKISSLWLAVPKVGGSFVKMTTFSFNV